MKTKNVTNKLATVSTYNDRRKSRIEREKQENDGILFLEKEEDKQAYIAAHEEERIRGFYDGTNSKEMDQLLNDIKILKNSY
mgnify:CR=1 FL=1